MKKIQIFDTTLRDGVQGEGISFSPGDKLKIVAALDELGVDFIECGNPASNPKDEQLFAQLAKNPTKYSKIVAFGSTRRKNTAVENDENIKSLLLANTEFVTIFGKSSLLHVGEVLNTTPEENLAMIFDSVSFMKANGKTVFYDAEHFFDGYSENPVYALETLKAAKDAGANMLVLCDTNGGAYFSEISKIVKIVINTFNVDVGIHCHNDRGLAVANSLSAVDAGAVQVQGTYLGFGERCGNANLSTIIPDLRIKRGYACLPESSLPLITPTARRIADIANFTISGQKPYIGYSAFAHKGGMHIDGVTKLSSSFEHISPELVGNSRRLLMSEVSGKSTLMGRINKIAPELKRDNPQVDAIITKLKELEFAGYQFEAAEESFELVIYRTLGLLPEFFELEYFRITGEQPAGEWPSKAIIKIWVDGTAEITAAEGDGPVHALDLALKKALVGFYPSLSKVSLTDFKVRVLDSDATTAAGVRVLIESTDGEHYWSTVGVSSDIIEASFRALSDSIEYKLMLDHTKNRSK